MEKSSLEAAELAGARGSRNRQTETEIETGEARVLRGRGQAKAKGTDLHDVLHEGELEHPVEMQRLVFENVLDAHENEILSLSLSLSLILRCTRNPHNSSEQ